MHQYQEMISNRIQFLSKIIGEKERALAKAPEGSVHVFSSDKKTQFYLNKDGKRKYMKDSEMKLVQKLCQKDYDKKILTEAKKELKELKKLDKHLENESCESIYHKLSGARQSLVTPIWLPDDEYIKQWEAVPYISKGFAPDDPEYYTDRGERVRSKSEILIANALKKHKIPYRFEYPYQFEPYSKTKHPDFTVLNVRTRKEFIWEHMGKMDDEGYRDYALNRIIDFEKHGIFPGDRLILTHETLNNPLNSKIIEKTILHYLK